MRQQASIRIRAALPGDTGAIAAALMTGDRGAISDGALAAMRDARLAHLLAISGLHIGLFAGLIFFGLRAGLALIPALALRFPIKKWAAIGALMGALFYLLMTGATVPTQRAFIMAAIVLAGVLLERNAISMRNVALAALAVLLMAPEVLLGASFQMSFAAVVALVAAYELRPRDGILGPGWRRRRVLVYALGVAVTTLIATAATTPFAVYHFNRLVLYGLAANLIAVPLTALWIMPWSIVAFALMPFGLEGLALAPMGIGIDAVVWSASSVSSWPGAVQLVPAMPMWGLVLTAVGGLWLLLWRERWRWCGVGAVMAGMLSLAAANPPDIFISRDADQAAVRLPGGPYVSGRRNTFDAELWLRRSGLKSAEIWGRASDAARCDGQGCTAGAGQDLIAFARSRDALEEDCRRATIVIAAVPVRGRCPSARLVIDRFDVWREGAHAVWLSGDRIRVKTSAEVRGLRPWVETKNRDD